MVRRLSFPDQNNIGKKKVKGSKTSKYMLAESQKLKQTNK